MTREWCDWQASITTWVNEKDELGHPDWNPLTCTGMQQFVAYALRHQLGSPGGIDPGGVCEQVFLSMGGFKRVEQIVHEAWSVSLRSPPTMELSTGGADDEEMKKLMQAAQEYAATLYSKLRGQKEASDSLNTAKMDVAAFDTG